MLFSGGAAAVAPWLDDHKWRVYKNQAVSIWQGTDLLPTTSE